MLRTRRASRHSVSFVVCCLLAVGLMLGATACGGDSDPTPAPEGGTTAIPTATPFAVQPEPVIVSADPGGATPDTVYVVQPGDTVSAIAERFDTTVEEILAANGLASDTLLVDQELLIPGSSAPTAPPAADDGDDGDDEDSAPGTGSDLDDGESYVVEPGDTAFGIALRFDVTLADLAAANGLSEAELNNLQVGDQLVLPRPR